MKITKAVITAAGSDQRSLPLQSLVDRDGKTKSALEIIVEEALSAGVEDIAVVVYPGDEEAYAQGSRESAGHLTFLPQHPPRGYGHALLSARDFVGDDAFLHLVSDHLYVSHARTRCARQLVEFAERESCAVSAVQATREANLPMYGTLGGVPVAGGKGVYEIETVLEKPTPTQAEQALVVPGLRAGHYLCFFGMHVLTPQVMTLLQELWEELPADRSLQLSSALALLAEREQYLALHLSGQRYNIGVKYGLFLAQLALALDGSEREDVLAGIVELMATREIEA
jgi:UTP--glucose-1-phosphate uridylyltransferase